MCDLHVCVYVYTVKWLKAQILHWRIGGAASRHGMPFALHNAENLLIETFWFDFSASNRDKNKKKSAPPRLGQSMAP